MTQACCDDIIDVKARLHTIEGWRDSHEAENRETFQRLFDKLEEALSRPPIWVTALVGVLTTMIGLLAGALWHFM